jgi:hypothetical protein
VYTKAASSHDAVRKAVALLLDPFWKGPKPKAGTVLRVCPMGGKGNVGATHLEKA